MAVVPLYGVQYPPAPPLNLPLARATSLVIDATGEKVALIGMVWNKDHASKNISRLGLYFGNVTKAGGSALTVSLQNVSTAAGPPYQPDETQDQTVAVANADAAFVSNGYLRTGALSASRTVAFGELLAVVIEYDGAGRLGADSVVISALTAPSSVSTQLNGGRALKTGGTWAAVAGLVTNIILEFDDGTFGTLLDAIPHNSIVATAFNSGSAADELALEFTVPSTLLVDGAWIATLPAASASCDVVLYDGTTALVTVSIDFHTLESTSNRLIRVSFAEQTLTAGKTYRLALKPTTANNLTVYSLTVANSDHLQAWPLTTSAYYASRVDAGSWTPDTAKRPLMGLYLSGYEAGSAGALLTPPGLSGGLQ